MATAVDLAAELVDLVAGSVFEMQVMVRGAVVTATAAAMETQHYAHEVASYLITVSDLTLD